VRLLANENFPRVAIIELRDAGHDVAWIREDDPGAQDAAVLQRAQAEDRVLVTFDKDFGELAFRSRLPASSGVILWRIRAPSAQHVAETAKRVLASRTDWQGHFSVVEDHRIRMTPLPS